MLTIDVLNTSKILRSSVGLVTGTEKDTVF